MKFCTAFVLAITIASCNSNTATPTPTSTTTTDSAAPQLAGTWKLLKGELVEKGDTTTTDYSKGPSFIKIINGSHFAFLQHNPDPKSDSAMFSAGGGRYTLSGDKYTEHLEYCSDRAWEAHDFNFTVTLTGDTLVQHGREEVAGVDRLNTETYVRLKD